MINWKGFGRKRSWPNFKLLIQQWLEGLRKTTENLSQDIQSLDQDLNLRPPKYETGVLTTRP
jgi:hypothetical protein